MPIEADVIYLAGFFDGEGCISINKQQNTSMRGAHRYQLHIRVFQKTIEPLPEFLSVFGGAIHPSAGGFTWIAGSQIAAKALQRLLPHLKKKDLEAELAISFQARKKMGRYTDVERESIIIDDEYDYQLMRQLKVG